MGPRRGEEGKRELKEGSMVVYSLVVESFEGLCKVEGRCQRLAVAARSLHPNSGPFGLPNRGFRLGCTPPLLFTEKPSDN